MAFYVRHGCFKHACRYILDQVSPRFNLYLYSLKQLCHTIFMILLFFFFSGARDGAAVRAALACHQCGPGSNPGIDAVWVEFVVGSLLYSKRFFSWFFGFLPPFKNQHFQIPIRKVEPLFGCATSQSLLISYFFT